MSSTQSGAESLFYGALSGALTIWLTQPFFTYQTYTMAGEILPPAKQILLNTAKLVPYLGSALVGRVIPPALLSQPHMGVWYRGSFPNLVCEVATQAVSYATFQVMKKRQGEDSSWQSSLVAGVVSSPIVCSLERVMMLQQILGLSTKAVITKIVKNEGVLQLCRGLIPTLAREIPFTYSVFYLSPLVSAFLQSYLPYKEPAAVAAQLLSGAVCGFLTTPAARVKALLQIDETGLRMSAVIKKIYGSEKIRGFFVGGAERVVTISAFSVIMSQSLDRIPKAFQAKELA